MYTRNDLKNDLLYTGPADLLKLSKQFSPPPFHVLISMLKLVLQ